MMSLVFGASFGGTAFKHHGVRCEQFRGCFHLTAMKRGVKGVDDSNDWS